MNSVANSVMCLDRNRQPYFSILLEILSAVPFRNLDQCESHAIASKSEQTIRNSSKKRPKIIGKS